MTPAQRSGCRAAVAMLTNPPIECPMTTGAPSMPPASATATTSSVHVSSVYTSRCPLSPCPDRSTATTRNSSANRAATWVHQWACAPPPCTKTSPRVPGRPQARKWIGTPSTSTVPSSNGTASACRNQSGADGIGSMSIGAHPGPTQSRAASQSA